MQIARLVRLVVPSLALALSACASLKAPTLQVESLKVGKLGITGAGMDVGFRVQNPNADALLIEKMEYELKLNGRHLGRGYVSEPLDLPGFKNQRVDSRFALNFLRLPEAVMRVLDQDRAKVEVKGTFYVRQGGGLKKLGFKSDANVDVRR
jgi:LEA14-like dessication related protein